MYSLRKRIARNLSLNLLAVMVGLLIVMYFFVQQLLHDYILTHLQHDAESLANVIYKDPDEGWKIDPERMSTIYSRVRSGHYYYVAADQQVLISRSLFDAEFPGVKDNNPSGGDYQADGPGDERWMIWHQYVTKNDQMIGIWIAEDIAPLQHQLLQYSAVIIGVIVIVTTLLFFLQQRTLHQAFEVFDWLRMNLTAIRQMEGKKSQVPIPLEVMPLLKEIEKLADHLSHRIVRTRNAMGNLAHELKRPLQLLAIQLETGRDKDMKKTLVEIRQLLERELRRARISGSSSAVGVFCITKEMDYMLDVLRKIYPHIKIDTQIERRIETLELDRHDMLELIGNLLDNACKFARSRIRCKVASAERVLELVFEDDGNGLRPEQLQQLNRRGQRLDERVSGHGLGLGICRDILNYYNGELIFGKSELGGLCVIIKIPMP